MCDTTHMDSKAAKKQHDQRSRQVLRAVRSRIAATMSAKEMLSKPTALAAGLGATYVRDLLMDDRAETEIQLGKLASIAHVLGVSIGYLLGETDDPSVKALPALLPDDAVAHIILRGVLRGVNRDAPIDNQVNAVWDAFLLGVENVQASPQLRQQPDLLASISQTAAARHR